MRSAYTSIVIVLFALAGCGGSSGGAPTRSAAKKTSPKAKAASQTADSTVATDVASEFVYQYSPVAKRDPFRSMVDRGVAQREGAPCNEPLCQFELDQLKLVGVVSGMANAFGMVEDPQGRGYIVRRNTKIGRQGGKVTQILRDSLTVTEYWTGPDGKLNPNPVSMQLSPERAQAREMDLNTGKQY